jgi:hypothetical protein
MFQQMVAGFQLYAATLGAGIMQIHKFPFHQYTISLELWQVDDIDGC